MDVEHPIWLELQFSNEAVMTGSFENWISSQIDQ